MEAIPLNISRKELAIIVRLSPDQIRRSEKRIGLDRTRVNFNRHLVLYRTAEALHIFHVRGFALSPVIISFLRQHATTVHFRPIQS
jgi:hypothetical protein